jgi:nitrate reductase gamma subunit
MGYKLRIVLRVVGHTFLSFVAAIFGGSLFQAFIQPLVGKARYSRTPNDPFMLALLLVIVALGGVVAYRRWFDRCSFFAWVFPTIWLCHLMLSRGMEAMQGRWSDPLFYFGIGAAYSLGAFFASIRKLPTTDASPLSD